MSLSFLESPLSTLSIFSKRDLSSLSKLKIHTLKHLLKHFPIGYQDKTKLLPLTNLSPKETALIEGKVLSKKVSYIPKKRLEVILSDTYSDESIALYFFYFYPTQVKQFEIGATVRCYGEIRHQGNKMLLFHPDYEVNPQEHSPSVTPIYPIVSGVSQKKINQLLSKGLAFLLENSSTFLDTPFFTNTALTTLQAIVDIHQPKRWCDNLLSRETDAFQYLKLHELTSYFLHRYTFTPIENETTQAFTLDKNDESRFIEQLPFSLTKDQLQSMQEIKNDLASHTPMKRLLHGEVGSGKTLVALYSAFIVAKDKHQIAFMLPTEVLAYQLYENAERYLAPFNISITLLTGNMKKKDTRPIHQAIANGDIQLIIGTHTLFQSTLKFQSLSLVIIDEQQRFGVHQRLSLMEKGQSPHQLIMTATPIPRTIAMSIYHYLTISTIKTLPNNRQPITTTSIPLEKKPLLFERIKKQLNQGTQIYWICPLIHESEHIDAIDVKTCTELLKKQFPNTSIDCLHGQLPTESKQMLIKNFKAGIIQILIATTVIEVGIDHPNASIMIIENAERMGLSQLHQLRGRVGRGEINSFCVLIYKDDCSNISKKRIRLICESSDGFKISEADLEIRGSGNLFGTEQTGKSHFEVANIFSDHELLNQAKNLADSLYQTQSPELIKDNIAFWQSNDYFLV